MSTETLIFILISTKIALRPVVDPVLFLVKQVNRQL